MTDEIFAALIAFGFIAFCAFVCVPPRTCTICAEIVPRRKTVAHYFDKHQYQGRSSHE